MKIVLAVDGSPSSADAAEAVTARPWPAGTVVRVLSAVEDVTPPAAELWYDAGGSLERARQELMTHAERLTAGLAETLRASGLTAETTVRYGDARSVIVDEAKEWDADLIVVGSHGYTGLKRWLLGSVAQSVVSHAPCSVEVVRQKSGAEQAGST
ncbi:MAG: universal stress protein [Acidobacteria bacterium]|nr:MAG: universal stress protein [Acidobacteriota bacterium]